MKTSITHLAEPVNVPMAVSRRVLDRDLTSHYGAGKSLSLQVDEINIASDEIRICNLSDNGSDWANKQDDNYAIDPALGRIVAAGRAGAPTPACASPIITGSAPRWAAASTDARPRSLAT